MEKRIDDVGWIYVSFLISSGVEVIGETSNALSFYGRSGWSQNTIMAVTIAAGGLSGGLSSTIAGGKFWAGARQGLITSGLNHAMHSMVDDFRIDKVLKKAGYDPDAQAEFSVEYVRKMIEELTPLRKLAKEGKLTCRALRIKLNPEESLGDIVAITSLDGTITLYKSVFETNRYLALTTGHELVHRQHHLFGLINKWASDARPGLEDIYSHHISEGFAYTWTGYWGGTSAYRIAEAHFNTARQYRK